MKPTDEQVKEFWEWCGLHKDGHFWHTSEGKQLSEETPGIDTNNLFEYAVPKLSREKLWVKLQTVSVASSYIATIVDNQDKKIQKYSEDPALALFWAIYEAMKNET